MKKINQESKTKFSFFYSRKQATSTLKRDKNKSKTFFFNMEHDKIVNNTYNILYR